jgi:tetratricopeptide (TPR) repeat protein
MIRMLIVSVSWLFVALAPCLPRAYSEDAGSRERTFVRALELFDSAKSNEDYREASQLLESLLEDGFKNGAVYYNLGNAYFRAGEYGRAILNYRKALPYRPRDPYLIANLQQAVAAAPGKLGDSPKPWWNHVLFWSDWFSYPTKIKIVFTCIAAMALFTVAAVYSRIRLFYWALLVVALISFVGGLELLLQYSEVELEKRAVIIAETIARKGTGNSYEAAFDQPLRDGAEFRVLSETADWTLGHFEGIGDGWVRNEFVAR